MATGDRVVTPWQWQHEVLEAAQERGWLVTRTDIRTGVTLEEPVGHGITMVLTGVRLNAAFIRSLPEARQPDPHESEIRYSRADPNRGAS